VCDHSAGLPASPPLRPALRGHNGPKAYRGTPDIENSHVFTFFFFTIIIHLSGSRRWKRHR
jgi:hypothetical protein